MKLPVTVISGYLGAGKTTLINHLLRNANGLRLAVLVNEFGALAIDEDLIEAEEDGLMSISGGCVCCAFGGDMIGVLEDIRDSKPGFDHVLLEASGVALPGSIITTVGLVDGLRPDASVVLADAEQIQRNASNKYLSDTVLRQLEQADILLVTKTDLVGSERLVAVENWLKARASRAIVLCVAHGQIPLEALVGGTPLAGRHGTAEGSKSAFASTVLSPDRIIDAEDLARSLAEAASITRAKGYVRTKEGLALIHVVGERYEVEAAEGPHDVGVVCIGARALFDAELVQSLVHAKP
ncbi:GTP-binding protein [Aestuariicoccus sp. MJ-SS9]|uniref:CobW family GTP-binding protein n=1 Tax=Aestuariicoccus sp. MJ-SS9 TaxID=3079855 RepID=UPI002906F1CA|nr:GTP-binding protein [Aestuariicoccus sp. MJ-SS9]MDU8911007.1 GTP-binding protein [Aestuariicoccus sp. MJ-SS9]